MKIKVECGSCGAGFSAPDTLAGQTVKCPRCGAPITVKAGGSSSKGAGGAAEADSGGGFDLSSLAPSPEAMSGSMAGGKARGKGKSRRGSSMGSSSGSMAGIGAGASGSKSGSTFGSRAGTNFDAGAQPGESAQEVDDRLARLYGVYMNKELRTERKGKFTLGLGISIAVIAVGLFLGGMLLLGGEENAPTVVHSGPTGSRNTGEVAVEVESLNLVDPPATWAPADANAKSALPLAQTAVAFSRDATGSEHSFEVRLQPTAEGQRQVDMRLQTALYRATRPEGPFTLVGRAAVSRIDGSDVLFTVTDAAVNTLGVNQVHYRLLGLDGDGRRLFETPVADVPVVPAAMLSPTRVTWNPIKPGEHVPPVAIAWTLAADGWEDVPLVQYSTDDHPGKGIDEAAPKFDGPFKTRTVMSVRQPVSLTMDADASDPRWTMGYIHRELASDGRMSPSPVGVVPVGEGQGLTYRFLPSRDAFDRVDEVRSGDERVLTFRLKGDSAPQVVRLPELPKPTKLVVTAFDQEVRLSWDSQDLVDRRDRFEGPIAVGIYRSGAQGRRDLVAVVQPDVNQWADTNVQPGQTYLYELEVTRPGMAGGSPMVMAPAWISGTGETPVLTRVAPRSGPAEAVTDLSLVHLTVALGRDELVYPDTDDAAIAISDQIIARLLDDPDVTLVHRKGLLWLRSAYSRSANLDPVPGKAAHVHLRLVDVDRPAGRAVALYATDLRTGETEQLAQTPVDKVDAEAFVRAVEQYLEPRRRVTEVADLASPSAPKRFLMGPIVPADQPQRFWGAGDFADRLTAAITQAVPEATILQGPDLQKLLAFQDVPVDQAREDVLLVGRGWITPTGTPGIAVYALDLATGQVLQRFEADAITDQTDGELAAWAGSITVPGQTTPTGSSPVRSVEAALRPIHPVWRAAVQTPAPFGMGQSLAREPGSITIALGAAMPAALRDVQPSPHRPSTDPLAIVRPYIATTMPLTFDAWAQTYAQWVRHDAEAFQRGIDQLNEVLAADPANFKPYLIVRGEVVSAGEPLMVRGRLSGRVEHLLAFDYLQRDRNDAGMVHYREDLERQFQSAPWRTYHAWGEVPRDIAVPVCQAIGAGVYERSRIKAFVEPKEPPSLAEFAAARVCGDEARAREFVNISRNLARDALSTLQGIQPNRMLNQNEAEYARNALLILLFENDPGVIQAMQNAKFRDRFLRVPLGQEADTLRLLVDRVGPSAWSWTNGEGGQIDWTAFRWRSPQEMQVLVNNQPELLPVAYREQVQDWIDQSLNAQSLPEPTGPPSLNANSQ